MSITNQNLSRTNFNLKCANCGNLKQHMFQLHHETFADFYLCKECFDLHYKKGHLCKFCGKPKEYVIENDPTNNYIVLDKPISICRKCFDNIHFPNPLKSLKK